MENRVLIERTAAEVQKLLWDGHKLDGKAGTLSYANDIYFFHTRARGLEAASQSFPDLLVQAFLLGMEIN